MNRHLYKIKLHKKIIMIIIISVCLIVLSAVYCISAHNQANNTSVINSASITGQADLQNYYSDKIKKLLTPDEMKTLSKRQWKYLVNINGELFNTNTIYLDKTENIRLTFSAFVEDQDILPKDILKQGRFYSQNEKLSDYISICSTAEYNASVEEDGINQTYVYEFTNVPQSTVISITLGDLFKKLLIDNPGVTQNRIEIITR